ncbi:esterase [[Mycobacterium] vasticus]|uniref:Esterase n=1 Tax=[Mycobacterium] vasticus TaxID=2875777 RepID=A0ABU5Z1K0_9MYCO|nr:esterase [Mycolicibacter sp. MYC017]MEB3071274.1 esterase [Mycolicibacter sp. MYC017]
MRSFAVAVVAIGATMFGCHAVAVAAPTDYCAELHGGNAGRTCEIQLSETGYTVDISMPLNYPDQKPVAEYIAATRDAFLNSTKAGASGSTPSRLSIKPTEYSSAIPPRGTQSVVFTVNQNIGGAQPSTTYKAFNWDQTYRKSILFGAAADDKDHAPLWQVDDPLKTVAPIVQTELQQQLAPSPPASTTSGTTASATAPAPLPIAQAALYDPNNYQNFAVVNDGVIFFFDQGVLLPASAGGLHVLVPRAAIDPMIA